MKSYTNTTSSMNEQTMTLSRRHFVASAGIAPLALGAAGSLLSPATAQAGVMDILENDNILGDPKAPISIVEYASLTCSHCANFHTNAFKNIQEDYIDTGKAFLIYRDFPLDRFAFQASVLAHAAGKDRFFAVLKILFEKQAEWTTAPDITAALTKIGNMVGVSKATYEKNLADEKLGESILTDRMVGANEYGVNSTPTLFINGEKYEGSREYEVLGPYLAGI
ncbi:DsbA family protein [Sneathiella aquimaris]|uniref:DsbA family protein n=1 Tax=Sneathiella aquimaris TaxID=2599305 RepID=UPI00146E0945|nr:DsbA family protein [Sneathiella aquimaris]